MGLLSWLLSSPKHPPSDGEYTCARCDGKGKVYRPPKFPEWESGEWDDCGRCDGTGTVEVRQGKVIQDHPSKSSRSSHRI